VDAFITYGLQIFIGTLALLGVWKDWSEKKKNQQKRKKRFYIGWVLLTLVVLGLSIADTHVNRAKNEKDRREAASAKQLADSNSQFLTAQVQQLRDDSKSNSDGFRKSFDGLYQRFADLKAKVTNAELIKEIDETKKELQATQAKLVAPKPTLVPSFFLADYNYETPILESTVTRSIDGSVPIAFVVANPSSVTALHGEIALRICTVCVFAKEPAGFIKRSGAPGQDRSKEFEHILAMTTLEQMTADLTVPTDVHRFEVNVLIVCENCDRVVQRLFVNVN
jgi:hypothetical protein